MSKGFSRVCFDFIIVLRIFTLEIDKLHESMRKVRDKVRYQRPLSTISEDEDLDKQKLQDALTELKPIT